MAAKIKTGDCLEVLKTMPAESVQTCVTSPPYYGLRDYGHDGQIGLEQTPDAYISKLVDVFREVRRVLKNDGTLWLNLGDSYASPIKGSGGSNPDTSPLQSGKGKENFQSFAPRKFNMGDAKPKDLLMIPARVALALQADGWYLRSEIIWHKPNPMPESVKDRPTKSHEMIYLLAKSGKATVWKSRDTLEWSYSPDLSEKIERQEGDFINRWMGYDYYYDADAVREPYAESSLPRALRGVSENNKWAEGAPGSTAHTMSKARKNRRKEWEGSEGGNGSGFKGHSDYYSEDGRLLVNPLGRNRRDVWTVTTKPYKGAHFATFPPDLIEPCILAGSRIGDTVLDPFNGAGTTGVVAKKYNRNYVGIELNPEYVKLTQGRLED